MQPHHTPNAHTTQNATEEWRDIPGYEGRYQVSSHGRVQSLHFNGRRRKNPRLLTPGIHSLGYVRYRLYVGCEGKHFFAHRLVMLAFVGESDLEVNHKDGDKTNNRLDNLEYVTRKQNQRHAAHVLGRWQGRGGKKPKPTPRDREIRAMAKAGTPYKEIAEKYGISRPYVSMIVTGKRRPEQ